VDADKISLAAYLPQKERDNFTPARIKYASISSFKARVLSDALTEDVEIHSLLAVAFGIVQGQRMHSIKNCYWNGIDISSILQSLA